jgi:hypothetical protein
MAVAGRSAGLRFDWSSEMNCLFFASGLRHAWGVFHPDTPVADDASSWRRSEPNDSPTRRMDDVRVPGADQIFDATVPTAAGSDMAAFRPLLGHLPAGMTGRRSTRSRTW